MNDQSDAVAVLGMQFANELIASITMCVHPSDFKYDRDDALLREYVNNVAELAIEHRRKHAGVYHWPELTSIQVENLKYWAVSRVVDQIRKK